MYQSNTDLALATGGFSRQSLANMSKGAQRRTGREIEQIQSRVLAAAVHEDGRAFVTNRALENTGALSAFEEHLITVAPVGEDRYRHIVDAYALGAAAKIQRW